LSKIQNYLDAPVNAQTFAASIGYTIFSQGIKETLEAGDTLFCSFVQTKSVPGLIEFKNIIQSRF